MLDCRAGGFYLMRKQKSRSDTAAVSLAREYSEAAAPAIVARTPGQGCLYLIATPIGNLEDISLRALRLMKEADVIACEDTRETRKLLNRYDIHTRLESYHQHNELTRAPELVIVLEQGAKVALVSDAGTPLVSDPGHRLVTLCLRHRRWWRRWRRRGCLPSNFYSRDFCLRGLARDARPCAGSPRFPRRWCFMRRRIGFLKCWRTR